MFDEIKDLEALITPELLSMAQELQVTVHNQAYQDTLPISDEKKKDIISLLNLIPEVYHDFYKNLKSKGGITDPLISSDDEEI
jgi:hypothetical protein